MSALTVRLAGFFGVPLLSALAPFLILPVISRISGAAGWGSFNAAQQIGVLAAVAVTFGWGIYGPPAVSQTTSESERRGYYRNSLIARLAVFAFVAPVASLVTVAVVNHDFLLDSIFMTVAMAAAGLLPSWYCIGVGKPGLLARYDVLPRLGATLLAVPILLATGEIWVYPALTLLAVAIATAAFTRRMLQGAERAPARPPIRTIMRQTLSTAAIDTTGNAYGSTPVPIATASLLEADSAAFGSADRAYRIGLSVVVVALGNAFQGWTLDPDATDPRSRHLLAIGTHTATGLVGGLALALLGPWATSVFFGADVAATPTLCLWFGVSFFFISLTTPLIRNLLIPHGRSRYVLLATGVSSIVGLTTMAAGAIGRSGEMIAFGLALSELVIAGFLLGPALRLLPARVVSPARS